MRRAILPVTGWNQPHSEIRNAFKDPLHHVVWPNIASQTGEVRGTRGLSRSAESRSEHFWVSTPEHGEKIPLPVFYCRKHSISFNMSSPTNLAEHRKQASDLTMGVSSSCIYDAVVKELRCRNASGSCLDYGAGAGALLKLLHTCGIFKQLIGADLMSRPADLDESIQWIQQDLNDDLESPQPQFDALVSSEVIEHLENPRAVFRDFYTKLKPGGILIVTTPNQQSIRSLISLVTMGHFDQFRDRDYPRHITALLHADLERCAKEAGFQDGRFSYTDDGLLPLPKLTAKWQQIFPKILRGKLFSDNVIYSCIKPMN